MPKVGNLCGCSKFGSDQRLLPQDHIVPFYNLKVSLTDETGTIDNCILSTTVAEKMMGETVGNIKSIPIHNLMIKHHFFPRQISLVH